MDEGAYGPIDALPEGYSPSELEATVAESGPEAGTSVALLPAPPRPSSRVAGPGEHAGYVSPTPVFDVYQPPRQAPRWAHGPVPLPQNAQAVGATAPLGLPNQTWGHLGLSLVALAVGIGVGAKKGGLAGAAAGGLLAGAAVNGYSAIAEYRRGTESGDKEGAISVLYGLVGAIGGGWLWMRYVRSDKRFAKNAERDGDYAIRRAGP